jgi:uncharacterized protein involved in outer membrane biogenesis
MPHLRNPHRLPRILAWTGGVLLALVAIAVIVLATLDWNRFRQPIARFVSERSGYDVRIAGDLRVRVLTLSPSASVRGVTVTNPHWRGRSRLLAFDDATVEVKLLPLLIGRVIVERLTVTRPTVDLYMDRRGRANWHTPRKRAADDGEPARPPDLPVVRRFVIAGGKIRVEDLKHRLKVSGTLAAAETARRADEKPFRFEAQGTLNREPFRLTVDGGPLINLDPGEPYTFDAQVAAGATQVAARGVLPEPFDLSKARLTAAIVGRDLADLYFVSGVALPNSRPYRLAAEIHANGTRITIPAIDGQVGSSDLSGKGSVDLAHERPLLQATLASRKLDLGDLAAPLGVGLDTKGTLDPTRAQTLADSRRTSADPNRRLLPDLELQTERVNAVDARVTYRAAAVVARRLPFRDVELGVNLRAGVLQLDPIAVRFDPGRMTGTVRIDARGDVPSTRVDLRITGVELGKVKFLKAKTREQGNGLLPERPPLEGVLQGRIRLSGRGASVRQFAANADGGLTFVIPRGRVNQAFAELTGINVAKGLGLLLKDDEERTGLRCGVADFAVEKGTVHARNVLFDTDVVRIAGRGRVDLGRERLDLEIQGKPKKVSVARLRTPIEIQGTFAKPEFGVDAGRLAKQGGIAAALGAVLTPLASILAFVDPGLAEDADCAALLGEAKSRGAPVNTRTAQREPVAAGGG